MPIIRIESLITDQHFSIQKICKEISKHFSEMTKIDEKFISVVWYTIQPACYCEAGITASSQPENSHPALVTLLVPNIHSQYRQKELLNALAKSMTKYTPFKLDNIFIHLQVAESGQVFDQGEIQYFD